MYCEHFRQRLSAHFGLPLARLLLLASDLRLWPLLPALTIRLLLALPGDAPLPLPLPLALLYLGPDLARVP